MINNNQNFMINLIKKNLTYIVLINNLDFFKD